MAVAGEKQSSPGVYGNKKRRARDQFFVVEIARVNPGRRARDAARNVRRRDTNAAKEWMQRNLDPVGKVRNHSFLIERDDAHLGIRKILRKKSASGTESVVSVRNRQLDLFDSDFEHVTRLSAFDEDWPGENVSTRAFVRNFFVDVAQRLLDIVWLHPRTFEARGTRCDEGLDLNRITRFDPHHRRRGGIVITPGYSLRGRFELQGLLSVN